MLSMRLCFLHRGLKKVEASLHKLRRKARVSLALRSADSDSRNLRMLTWESGLPHVQAALHGYMPCMLHQNAKNCRRDRANGGKGAHLWPFLSGKAAAYGKLLAARGVVSVSLRAPDSHD